MSEENLAVVRTAIEAFNRSDIDALTALSTDDFEFVSIMTAVDTAAVYSGRSAWAQYFAVIGEMWDEWHAEDVQLYDGGTDTVASSFRLVGTARQSGATVSQALGIAYQVRGGKLARLQSFLDPADARAAIGLDATE